MFPGGQLFIHPEFRYHYIEFFGIYLVGADVMVERGKVTVCSLLKRLERILKERPEEVPASDQVMFHVRRAMELARCNPKKPVIDELEAFRRGLIIE